MTESTPQPTPHTPTEEWDQTTHYETTGEGVRLRYPNGLPTTQRPEVPTYRQRVDLDQTPAPLSIPATETVAQTPALPAPREATSVSKVNTFDHTMRPEQIRALRANIIQPAGAAVVSAEVASTDEVASLEAQLDHLGNMFSKDERLDLWRYAAGTMNKEDAQKAGDGQGSIVEGQNAGQAYQKLSPAARQIAADYLRLMRQLRKVRHLG